jgi:hypothetical protein
MRQLLNQYLFRLIRYLHKRTETQLQGLKKEKKHGTPEYVKAAGQERKLRDLKKALQAKLESSKAPRKKA